MGGNRDHPSVSDDTKLNKKRECVENSYNVDWHTYIWIESLRCTIYLKTTKKQINSCNTNLCWHHEGIIHILMQLIKVRILTRQVCTPTTHSIHCDCAQQWYLKRDLVGPLWMLYFGRGQPQRQPCWVSMNAIFWTCTVCSFIMKHICPSVRSFWCFELF